MNTASLFYFVRSRMNRVFALYVLILGPMWIMFILNSTILFGLWNRLGIQPREISIDSLIGVIASWTMHGSFGHILGNSMALLQTLFIFGLFEKNPHTTIIKLIIGSGLMTWGLGSTFSIHVGASGLVFAMLGYIIGGAIFAKRWGYAVVCILMGTSYWVVIKQGLIPQAGISFAGHFGGLCIGLLLGSKSISERSYPTRYFR